MEILMPCLVLLSAPVLSAAASLPCLLVLILARCRLANWEYAVGFLVGLAYDAALLVLMGASRGGDALGYGLVLITLATVVYFVARGVTDRWLSLKQARSAGLVMALAALLACCIYLAVASDYAGPRPMGSAEPSQTDFFGGRITP